MDVDSENLYYPLLDYFDQTPDGFAWREPLPLQIETRRANLGDLLIFDILLSAGGIREPDRLYPPVDVQGLRRLLESIEHCTYDTLKKECLIYFLLKWHQDGREERFQLDRCIPPQFVALADAYWNLDSGANVLRAISALSDARLNRDYSSKILQAISLAPDATPLILKYVRTVKPPLTQPDDLGIYMIALAETNIFEAWQFQRTFNELDETRSRLFKKLIEWMVTPQPRKSALTQLLGLPLSSYEESVLHSFTLHPPSSLSLSSLAILQDLVCVRLIQGGRYVDAIKMDRQYISSIVRNTNSEARSQDRTAMVRELLPSLPRPERLLLEADLELIMEGKSSTMIMSPPPPRQTATTTTSAPIGDLSMSQSWEEIRMPQDEPEFSISAALHAAPSEGPAPILSAPISERAGAPRFGGTISAGNGLSNGSLSFTKTVTKTPSHAIVPKKSFISAQPITLSAPPPAQSRQSLSAAASQFVLGGSSSAASSSQSGIRGPKPVSPQPPLIPTSVSSKPFESANTKANAFYTPPSKPNGVAKTIFTPASEEPITLAAPVASPPEPTEMESHQPTEPTTNPNPHVEQDENTHMDDSDEKEPHQSDHQKKDQVPELNYSVFDGGRPRANGNGSLSTGSDAIMAEPSQERISAGLKPISKAKAEQSTTSISAGKRLPPGAFLAEDDEDINTDIDENDTDAGDYTGRYTTTTISGASSRHISGHSAPSASASREAPRGGKISEKRTPTKPASTSLPADAKRSSSTKLFPKLETSSARTKGGTSASSIRRAIPGSLMDEDDVASPIGDDDDDNVKPAPPPGRTSGSTRLNLGRRSSRRQLEDHDDTPATGTRPTKTSSTFSARAGEEEEDRVGPLPIASPVKRSMRKAGRTSITLADDEHGGEGGLKRRSSRRLSTTTGAGERTSDVELSPLQQLAKRLPRARKGAATGTTTTGGKKKKSSAAAAANP